MTEWLGHIAAPSPDNLFNKVAFTILFHTAAATDLTKESDLLRRLQELPREDCEKLVAAACQHADPSLANKRLGALLNEALTSEELESFDAVLREAEELVYVLDLSARLTAAWYDSDLHDRIGEKLFELDKLIDQLYLRPDLISVRWRILQRSDGTIPGWLTTAKALDEKLGRGRATEALDEKLGRTDQAPPTALDRAKHGETLHHLVRKALGPERSVIRFYEESEIAGTTKPPGKRIAGPLSSPDGRLEVDLLVGPQASTILIVFSSRDSKLSNALVGYVIEPGVDGEPVGGFAVLAPETETGWAVGEVVIGQQELARLRGVCYGVISGPVDSENLSEEAYSTILATARASEHA